MYARSIHRHEFERILGTAHESCGFIIEGHVKCLWALLNVYVLSKCFFNMQQCHLWIWINDRNCACVKMILAFGNSLECMRDLYTCVSLCAWIPPLECSLKRVWTLLNIYVLYVMCMSSLKFVWAHLHAIKFATICAPVPIMWWILGMRMCQVDSPLGASLKFHARSYPGMNFDGL
jgi:hypothetical protein